MQRLKKPFPLTPLVCLSGIIGGIVGFIWYDSRSREEQDEADERAMKLAKELFGKSVAQLTADESQQVQRLAEDFAL